MQSVQTKALVAVAAFAIAAAHVAHADVAYSSFASDGSDNPYSGPLITGSQAAVSGSHEFAHAASFVPTITGDLESIDLGLLIGNYGVDDGDVIVSLAANNPSGGPLTSLIYASGTVTAGLYPPSGYPVDTFTYTGPAITLAAGVTYWVIIAPVDATTEVGWGVSTIAGVPDDYQQLDGGQFTDLGLREGAFTVNVSPVPEPAAGAILGAGTVLALSRKARRRR